MKPFTRSIFHLFDGKRRYIIPLFQRQYVWNRERQWEPLWEDIMRISEMRWAKKQGPPHFLGALVLDQMKTFGNQVPAHLIIDGQQRLITFQILLAALRDIAKEIEALDFFSEVHRYLENTGIMENKDEEKYKVWPSKVDQDSFGSIIFLSPDCAAGNAIIKDNSLITNAYQYFRSTIKNYLESGDPRHRVENLFQALHHDLEVVSIELDNDDDPQVIFETLNARGEPLLPSDLLRNYLFWRAGRNDEDKDNLYEKYWLQFDQKFWKQEERLGRLKRPRIDIFMQHFLQSQEGQEINIGRLFHEYKTWINVSQPFPTVEKELTSLSFHAEKFRSLIEFKPENEPYGKFFWRLRQIDVGTVYPLIMHILCHPKCAEQDVEGMFIDLESYLFRRLICGLTAKNYNRIFLSLIKDLNKDGFTRASLQQSLLHLGGEASYWPDDSKFSEAWLSNKVYLELKPARRIIVILHAIEETLYKEKSEKIKIGIDKLSIEHIMPQNWHTKWILSDGSFTKDRISRIVEGISIPEAEERDSLIHTFGNLTILTQPLNSAISNSQWKEKRPEICKDSALALNREFQEVFKWDTQEIKERGKRLLSKAISIWPYHKKQVTRQDDLQTNLRRMK